MKPGFDTMRAAMIDSQLRTAGVSDQRLIQALAATPRELFVQPGRERLAYIDEDQPLGGGRWLIEPMVFGRLVNELRLAPSERVLIVGTGTGYSAAVLARLVAEVVAVEELPELAGRARHAIDALGLGNVRIVEARLTEGAPDLGPYDALLLEGSVELVPETLLGQVRDGGRIATVLVDPSGLGRASVGVVAGGSFGCTSFMDASVPRLPGFERSRGFIF